MKINWHDPGAGLTLSFLLIILGLVFSSVFRDIYYSGSLRLWRNLGSPPGGADQFVYAEGGVKKLSFVVSSKSSPPRYYMRNIKTKGVWEEVTEPTEKWLNYSTHWCYETPVGLNRLPDIYKDCIISVFAHPLGIDSATLVILNDGRVWVYSNSSNIVGDVEIAICPAPILLLMGWVFIFIKRRRIKNETPLE